jgi:hypothetical protein
MVVMPPIETAGGGTEQLMASAGSRFSSQTVPDLKVESLTEGDSYVGETHPYNCFDGALPKLPANLHLSACRRWRNVRTEGSRWPLVQHALENVS